MSLVTKSTWEVSVTIRRSFFSKFFTRCRRVISNLQFLPPTNEVWGKVIFLHLSVTHSVHRGVPSLAEEGVLSLAEGVCCP